MLGLALSDSYEDLVHPARSSYNTLVIFCADPPFIAPTKIMAGPIGSFQMQGAENRRHILG